MKKPIDRVAEAYYDQVGANFGEKVRKRIHWICGQAKGEKILDVGCSQGITSILLGRESKQVLAIDLWQETIDYAKDMLSIEAEDTKQSVEFKVANFIAYDFGDQKFDSIIFGEVLEHVADPERFINKATELLSDDGQMIVTVPFGINDYFDHKKTYYMQGLLDLQNSDIHIDSMEIMGKWIGAVFVKGQINTTTPDKALSVKLEDGLYELERDLLNQLASSKKQRAKWEQANSDTQEELANTINKLKHTEELNNHLKLSLNRTEDDFNEVKAELRKEKEYREDQERLVRDLTDKMQRLEQQHENLKQNNAEISQRNNFLEKKVTDLRESERQIKKKSQTQNNNQAQIDELQREVLREKKKKLQSDELLLEAYNKEERLLKKHAQILKRYDNLKSSKLGRVTTSYWRWRKNRFGGKSSGSKSN
ncbi:class I SAM-dependent methyltransferase [Gracilibacillus phocaeensis]|uniref:class I SAM-dependent methyltransferase n=1 Tax=Gracilibacillus phocaeensis TaxID=2042304 RepID=UPI0013EF3EFB|nr:methyltransferase domain-containing protein [Gracilibacillus phocaeensis]